MTRRVFASSALLLCLWGLCPAPVQAGGAIPAPAQAPTPAASPSGSGLAGDRLPYAGTRWEYRVETIWAGSVDGLAGAVANLVLASSDTDRLREWGEAGWELVSIQGTRAYLKRPIPPAPPAPAKAWWWPF